MEQQFPGKNYRRLTTACSSVILSAFGQKYNIFSICCGTFEFLLDILKVMITVNLCFSPLTDCYSFQRSTFSSCFNYVFTNTRRFWPVCPPVVARVLLNMENVTLNYIGQLFIVTDASRNVPKLLDYNH